MHIAPFILADDPEPWIKFVVFGVVGAIWLIGQAVTASNKLAKKTGKRPPAFGSPPRPMGTPQPPTFPSVGRPGGPATGALDRARLAQGRLAQARLAQARTAEARAAAARLAAAQRPAPIIQQRPAPSAPPRALQAPLAPSAPQRPLAPSAPAAASRIARPAVTRAALSPRAAATLASLSPRSGLLPRLTSQSLRSQFILTEILRPPLALRQGDER